MMMGVWGGGNSAQDRQTYTCVHTFISVIHASSGVVGVELEAERSLVEKPPPAPQGIPNSG